MALTKLEGVITRTVKYGESSVILDLLTPSKGVQSFIVGGIRSAGKLNRSAITRVPNIVSVEAYVTDGEKLSRIKEISYAHIYVSLPFDVLKGSIATFLIEITRKVVRLSDDAYAVYHFIVKGLIHLDNMQQGLAHFPIKFLIDLTHHVGVAIHSDHGPGRPYFHIKEGAFIQSYLDHRSTMDASDSQHLYHYITYGNSDTSREDRRRLLKYIIDYYRYHIDGFGQLNSLDILLHLYK